jgi:hypothetical protein
MLPSLTKLKVCGPENPLAMIFGSEDERELDETTSEFERYLTEPRVSCKTDATSWWKLNGDRYPSLACMARDYLVIPAISVPAERLFSCAGMSIRPPFTLTKYSS